MTTPSERTRALRQAGELVDLILSAPGLPEEIRLRAEGVQRHYPSAREIEQRAQHWDSEILRKSRWLAPEDR